MRWLLGVGCVVILLGGVSVFMILRSPIGRAKSQTQQSIPYSRPLTEDLSRAAQSVDWPSLPSAIGTQSPAKPSDVQNGRAAFAAAGRPAAIVVPQYAFYLDEDAHVRVPVIITQAESGGKGLEIVAYQSLDGRSNGLGLLREFELLGTDPKHRQQ
jgi:hypothetical protein